MISKIKLKEVATFDTEGIKIDLGKVNFIFGSNGTGKTTISEFLRNQQNFPTSNIEWKQNRSNFNLFVYNRNFVTENFNEHNEIKGIFTLGKKSSDISTSIDEKTKEIRSHDDQIGKLAEKIDNKNNDMINKNNDFIDRCWKLKIEYDDVFKEAFKGFRHNKERFMIKCKEEAENNQEEVKEFKELTNRVESIFKDSQEKNNLISQINYDKSLEEKSIFETKIIGKEDIDIANLISSLNISDWVQQGHEHMKNTNGVCPFCQQELPSKFEAKLEEYFDETYTKQIFNLNSAIEKYEFVTKETIEKMQFFIKEDNRFINTEKIAALVEAINSIYMKNMQSLERKKSEPSKGVELSSISSNIDKINLEIEKANRKILELNKLIDNIKEEKTSLIKDIWRFIVKENEFNYDNYIEGYKVDNKAFLGMKKSKEIKEKYKKELEKEVLELQSEITSVFQSVIEINKLLKSFGFTNFHLEESEIKGNYKIVRETGEDASETLSEGEKTFISFLYFYQLINGSNEQEEINTERIIVIDDPISSLDSNILFIVSNLINELKRKVRSNDSNFKQLILLTHNVYFHKEISFNKGRTQKLNDETFWILRKTDNISYITEYTENPIKNSYELLWKELKENQNSITIPNIMRRILENYFKFFGNIDVGEIIDKFPPEEKVVCNSLLSWAHDGSHHISDDLFIDSSKELNKKYFEIFKHIFIKSKHRAHFEMMMGSLDTEIIENNEDN